MKIFQLPKSRWTALKDKILTGSGSTGSSVQFELLLSDLHDNYRLFNLWETMLHQPIMFSEQLVLLGTESRRGREWMTPGDRK